MRRLLAIGLLLVLAFPFVSPLLASATESGAAMPVCCRKGGAHHCLSAMRIQMGTGQGIEVSTPYSPCAEFPKAIAQSHRADLILAVTPLAFAEPAGISSIVWQAEARARVALDRASRKRGPPTHRA